MLLNHIRQINQWYLLLIIKYLRVGYLIHQTTSGLPYSSSIFILCFPGKELRKKNGKGQLVEELTALLSVATPEIMNMR